MLNKPWGLEPIERALRAQADPEQAIPMRAYMLNQFEFLGIRAGPRREALKGWPKFTGTPDELLALVEALWRLPEREFRYAAVDLLAKHHKRLDLAALPRIVQWVQTDAWWDTVDGLAGVVGRHRLEGQKPGCRCPEGDGRVVGAPEFVGPTRGHVAPIRLA